MIWDKNCAKAYAQNTKSNRKITAEATCMILDENCAKAYAHNTKSPTKR